MLLLLQLLFLFLYCCFAVVIVVGFVRMQSIFEFRNEIEIHDFFSGEEIDIILVLITDGLLANDVVCTKCPGNNMRLTHRADRNGELCWRCSRCRQRISVRRGSFFEDMNLSYGKMMLLIFKWVVGNPPTITARALGISRYTTMEVYKELRSICQDQVDNHQYLLGGPGGQRVQIDESCFTVPRYHR